MQPWISGQREAWFADQCLKRITYGRVVEFGAAGGEITRELLTRGFSVTAIEAREESLAKIPPQARRILGDVEVMGPSDAGGPFDLALHVGVLYHLLGPLEHLIQLPLWAPRLLLDTHYSPTKDPQLHRERVQKPRAGLRSGSWWLPWPMLRERLEQDWKRIAVINDRIEPNGHRITVWCER